MVGVIITIIAFYLSLVSMNGSIMEPVNTIATTNHTVLNGTVIGDVNVSMSTWYTSTHITYPIIYTSGIMGMFIMMIGLIVGAITSFNIVEVVLSFREKSWR